MAKYQHDPADGPLKIVFFFSGGASSMKAVLESEGQRKDYQVVCSFTNASLEEAVGGYKVAHENEIEIEYIEPRKAASRQDFYETITERMEKYEADVVGLSGWLRKYSLMCDPFLSEFSCRILNVHPADLSIIYRPSLVGWCKRCGRF